MIGAPALGSLLERPDLDPPRDARAVHAGRSVAGHHGYAGACGGCCAITRLATHVDDRNDCYPARSQGFSSIVCGVTARDEHGPLTRADRVLHGIVHGCRSEHYAGYVVVREHYRALDGARREHHLRCAHVPETLAHRCWRGPFTAFAKRHQIVVVATERGCALEHARPRRRPQLALDGAHPVQCRLAIYDVLFPLKRASKNRPIIDEHDARPSPSGRERRGQPCRSATDDQHVAVLVSLLVPIGVGKSRRDAEACGAADERLEPVPVRPHEGLVVKPRRHQSGEQLERREDVKPRAGPAIHAACVESVEQLDLRGFEVRYEVGTPPDLHDGVRLLAPAAKQAPWPVQLEAPPSDAHAVGEQR